MPVQIAALSDHANKPLLFHLSSTQSTAIICNTVAILPMTRGRTLTLPTVIWITIIPASIKTSRPIMVTVNNSGMVCSYGRWSKLKNTIAETRSSLSASGSRMAPSSLRWLYRRAT